MQIIRSNTCKNSPKNEYFEDLTIALLSGDADALGAMLVEDAEIVFNARRTTMTSLLKMLPDEPLSIQVHSSITHGKAAASHAAIVHAAGRTHFALHGLMLSATKKTIEKLTVFSAETPPEAD